MSEKKPGLFWHPILFSFMSSIAAIEFIRMSMFITFLPSFFTNLGYGKIALGFVISANLLADNFLKGVTGWFVDRYGPWPVLLSGSLFVLVGTILIMNFHQNMFLMIVTSVLIGIGAAPTWPAAVSGALQTAGEEKRATVISMISVVWLLGGGSGIILLSFLIDPKFYGKLNLPIGDPYQAGFLLFIAVSVLAVIITLVGWMEWYRVPHIKVKLERGEIRKPNLRSAFKRLWTIKALIPGMFIQTMALGMLMPNLVPYATHHLGMTESQVGLLMLAGGIVVVLLMVPVGHFADHWGTKGFLASGFSLAAASLLVMIKFANTQNIWWIVGLFGLSYALIQPAWNALMAASIPPAQRGILMGLFMSVEGFGFGVGPAIGGWLGEIGTAIPFYVSSILLTAMAVVYIIYPFHQFHFEENECSTSE